MARKNGNVKFKLEKTAKKSGGDRYTAKLNDENWTVYFPQSISRKNSESPLEEITIKIIEE